MLCTAFQVKEDVDSGPLIWQCEVIHDLESFRDLEGQRPDWSRFKRGEEN